MLVHIKELFAGDVVGKFAYPAFNTMNLEITRGIVAAAEEVGVPVIMEVSEGAIAYAGLPTLYEIMATVAEGAKVPVAIHMDHGKDVEQLKRGIELGFSSVMIDHSKLAYEENVRDTKAMVEFAHQHGAWVQGEIGKIRGTEDWVSVDDSEALLTDPEEAERFYRETGVDTLAGSFGTIHGIVKMRGGAVPHVDTKRIAQVAQRVGIPLVLHGASGVDEVVIREAIQAGVAIINIDTELRVAFTDALRASVQSQPEEVDPRALFRPVIAAVTAAARKKLVQFGTKNIIKQQIVSA
ncbi:MAG: class II fructose-bisphosphate aldolase [Candidatus Doudnabacteria bacterium]|nr:class II fructose-bisphosphate aldolase [Candidatus Doudnabacteria bacterium]